MTIGAKKYIDTFVLRILRSLQFVFRDQIKID